MHTFTLNVITSSRQELTIRKEPGTTRVSVKGIDPEASYGQEDLADLARVFAGAKKLLE
jgi:hypothetical protein